jgi:hypothetical protein
MRFIHRNPRQLNYESDALGPMYGIIRHELPNVATSTLLWAVQLRASYTAFCRTGGISDDHLADLATTLDQDLPDHVYFDVESVS